VRDACLGGDGDIVSAVAEHLGQDLLRFTAGVAVGGVDVGETRGQCRFDHVAGDVDGHRVAEGHGAQDGAGELEVGHQAAPWAVAVGLRVRLRRDTTSRGLIPVMAVGSSAAARKALV